MLADSEPAERGKSIRGVKICAYRIEKSARVFNEGKSAKAKSVRQLSARWGTPKGRRWWAAVRWATDGSRDRTTAARALLGGRPLNFTAQSYLHNAMPAPGSRASRRKKRLVKKLLVDEQKNITSRGEEAVGQDERARG